MWNEPTEEELKTLPDLYETENVSLEKKIIHMHFFIGGCDWYVSEYGLSDRLFFGYAILNNDLQNAEWGYVSYDELRDINVRGIEIDRDLYWKPTPAAKVQKIREGHGWR